MENRKALLSAAVASLIAAGGIMKADASYAKEAAKAAGNDAKAEAGNDATKAEAGNDDSNGKKAKNDSDAKKAKDSSAAEKEHNGCASGNGCHTEPAK